MPSVSARRHKKGMGVSAFNKLGRSATVGSLGVGEAAIYFDRPTKKVGLAFCANFRTSPEQSESPATVAHAFRATAPELIFIEPESWRSIAAWVLPPSFQVELDFTSRISSRSLNSDRPWSFLFLDNEGRLLMPIYNPQIGVGEHRGWFSVSDMTFLPKPSLYDHDFQCFTRWGIVIQQSADPIQVWSNDFRDLTSQIKI